jgi:hypothetical protein
MAKIETAKDRYRADELALFARRITRHLMSIQRYQLNNEPIGASVQLGKTVAGGLRKKR